MLGVVVNILTYKRKRKQGFCKKELIIVEWG